MKDCGIFILHKEDGMTSHTAVKRLQRLLGASKAGHTGTLDPAATGVLPVLLGRGVKAAEFIFESDKHYRAVLRLGATSDTEDSTGCVTETGAPIPSEGEVLSAIAKMQGKQMQIPPMYSAVRVGGTRLMELARKGIEVERQPREIEIFEIFGRALSSTLYEIDVHCSKGTFIRTVCADIGKALGCGALMDKLIRTEAAGFKIADAHKLSDLEQMSERERQALILPLTDTLFKDLPRFSYPPFYEALAKNGAAILTKKLPGCDFALGQKVLLYDAEGFFALGEIKESEDGQVLSPIKKFRL